MEQKKCCFCYLLLINIFLDLGVFFFVNLFVVFESLYKMEFFYLLYIFVCNFCLFVQLDEFEFL